MLDDLVSRKREVIAALGRAFEDCRHDLLAKGKINASPDRHDRVRAILFKNDADLTGEDLDWLLVKSITTVGGPDTFRFVLPRFLALAIEDYGHTPWMVADWHHIASRLADASFDDWPPAQTQAIEAALALWAEMRMVDGLDSWSQDPVAVEIRDWVRDRRQNVGL